MISKMKYKVGKVIQLIKKSKNNGIQKYLGFQGSSVIKNMPANAGDVGSNPGSGRSLEKEGTGNPLQYSCLENPMDRGAWWATVHEVTKESDIT